MHAWQVLVKILECEDAEDMLVDVGMPVVHKNVIYNCRVVLFNKKILLIRPKMWMANDGNYRELRWFTPWQKYKQAEEHYLPKMVADVTGQHTCPIGHAVVATQDTSIGVELCEELFTPAACVYTSASKEGQTSPADGPRAPPPPPPPPPQGPGPRRYN